jgi:hypothetical protein
LVPKKIANFETFSGSQVSYVLFIFQREPNPRWTKLPFLFRFADLINYNIIDNYILY